MSFAEKIDLPELPPTQLLIGGQWIGADSGKTFATVNPATEQPIADIACAGASDIDKAVSAARAALDGPWGKMTGAERGRILRRISNLLENSADEIAWLESLDGGKPITATRRMDIPAAIDCLDYYAGWADKISGEVVPTRRDALTYVERVPVGVVAAIVPWNFPLMNAVWKIAPALACGCSIVLKPAELTPLTALWLGQAALTAGLPPGVLNIVPGYGHDAGAALVAHPGVDKISFTGSPVTGRFIMKAAAENITRVTLELGGKSPSVVFADADLEDAARAIVSGAFFNAGQVCSAATRVIVQDSIYDTFVDMLVARASSLRSGDTLETKTTLGPVISEKQMNRILEYIDGGKSAGARVATGGGRSSKRGFYISPTIFADASADMRIWREEIFGPVLAVARFSEEVDAVKLANGTDYSLAAAVWTRDIARATRMTRLIRAGTVWVNTYGPTDARLPWGGMGGQSGIGRDLGRSAIENYTEQKTIWIRHAPA